MIKYPHIDPVALSLGPIQIHWYGLMYLIGFLSAWGLASLRARKTGFLTLEQVSDMIFYAALGVIIGGRLGFMIVWNTHALWADPLSTFKIWQGGMSFHGGLVGVLIAFWYFARKHNKTILELSDFFVPMTPIGLAAGRLGNFINGELWGRVTDVPWAMVFPMADSLPRHPSQLYECLLEGALLFLILWFYSASPRPRGHVTGLFLILYGVFRSFAEFFREPSQTYGLIMGWMTDGQLLSLPMIIVGIWLLLRRTTRENVS